MCVMFETIYRCLAEWDLQLCELEKSQLTKEPKGLGFRV